MRNVMKIYGTVILSTAMIMLFGGNLIAQETSIEDELASLKKQNQMLSEAVNKLKAGKNQFRLTGFANITYHQDMDDFGDSRFAHAGFAPIFIWQPSEKLFFESELHIELEGGTHGGETGGGHGHGGGMAMGGGGISHAGATHLDLGYASIAYFLNDYVTVVAGKFLSPFGLYNERLHPSWINRLTSAPLGFGHGGAMPAAELGFQLRGGLALGKTKMNYAVYITNGPVLEDGLGDPDNAGALIYSNFSDNNANKAIGGRIGFLPLSNSSLEIGISGQQASKTGDRGTVYENVGAMLYGLDLTYVKDFRFLKGSIQLLGQYNVIDVEDAAYARDSMDILMDLSMAQNALDSSNVLTEYTFDNFSTVYYVQLSYRLSKFKSNVLKNLELVFRYDAADLGPDSKWAFSDSRYSIGLNYWLHARSAIKLEYQIGETANIMFLQWALGF